MNNPVGRQLYQEIDPFLQENVPTNFTFHFLDSESFESRDLTREKAGFRPDSEIIRKFRKSENYHGKFVKRQKWSLQTKFECVGVF